MFLATFITSVNYFINVSYIVVCLFFKDFDVTPASDSEINIVNCDIHMSTRMYSVKPYKERMLVKCNAIVLYL